MRRKQRLFLQLVLTFLMGVFLFAGCYTQFERPRADTDDGYYCEEEVVPQPDDEYQDQEVPYYDQADTNAVVNYNYYTNNNYYYDPFYDRWDSYWYTGFYDPYFYGYYYSGFYPGYWWDPYYHPYYPGWYFGFYSGYYYNDWWNYDRYWYGGGMYWVSSNKQRRNFNRRTLGQLERDVRRSQRESVRKAQRVPRTDNSGDKIVDRNDVRRGQLEPGRQSRPVSGERPALTKPRNDALPGRDTRKTTVDRKRMTIVKPEGRIIKRRPAGKTKAPRVGNKTIVRPQRSDARPSKNVKTPTAKKPNDAIRTNPKKKSTKPTSRVRPKNNPPRIKNKGHSSSYRPQLRPAPKTSRSNTSVRRSSRSAPNKSYSRPSTSRSSRSYSTPSVNRSSSRGTVSRPAPSSRSSSTGSKSSGSKTKNK